MWWRCRQVWRLTIFPSLSVPSRKNFLKKISFENSLVIVLVPRSLSGYTLLDLARFPDTHRPLSPSSPLPGGGYGVRHGNPGMLRRDLVNMRARMRPARVRPERCPSCIHLDGVHILPSRCSSKAKGNFVCTFALISHLDLIFILQPQRSSPSLVANPCLVGKRDGPPPAPPHSLSRCLMPSCLLAWQSSFTPSARGPSAVRQRDYIRVRVERAFSLRINRVRGRRAASAAASLFLLSR